MYQTLLRKEHAGTRCKPAPPSRDRKRMAGNLASQNTSVRRLVRATCSAIEERELGWRFFSGSPRDLSSSPFFFSWQPWLGRAVDVFFWCLRHLSLSLSLFRTARLPEKLVRARARYFTYRCTCVSVDSWQLSRLCYSQIQHYNMQRASVIKFIIHYSAVQKKA